MHGTPGRLGRLILAALFIPVGAWAGYFVARYIDGDPTTIDTNGSSLGVFVIVGSLFLISKLASPENWSERAGISLGLSAAYFLLSWVLFGEPETSADAAPHIVWYGACVFAFTPAVVLMPASQWAWSALRVRRGLV